MRFIQYALIVTLLLTFVTHTVTAKRRVAYMETGNRVEDRTEHGAVAIGIGVLTVVTVIIVICETVFDNNSSVPRLAKRGQTSLLLEQPLMGIGCQAAVSCVHAGGCWPIQNAGGFGKAGSVRLTGILSPEARR